MRLLPFDYAVRNLARRPLRSVLGALGHALVVLLVMAAVGFVRGMVQSLDVSADPHNVILLGVGSEESLERSEVPPGIEAIVASSVRGIRNVAGVDCVSPEVQMALNVRGAGGSERVAVVRGVTERVFLVHRRVQLVRGRLPISGADEVLVGGMVAAKLGVSAAQSGIGAQLTIDGRAWRVVGEFTAVGTVLDAELWLPLRDVMVIGKRDTLSCVVLTVTERERVADLAAFAAQRLDLELAVVTEVEYFAALTRFFAPIRALVLLTAILIAAGGLLGGVNTMYSAFVVRVRELAALQTLGFRRRALVFSLLQESVLLGVLGALPAVVLGMAVFSGLTIQFSMGAFGLAVDGVSAASGLATGIGLGLVGVLPAANQCLRLPIPVALRSA